MDRTALGLFDVRIRRTYTTEYLARWPGQNSHWDSTIQSWGTSADAVVTHREELQAPGRYASFDRMYRDSVVGIDQVSDKDLAERRAKAARYGPCCELAVIRNCVCEFSSTCPVHGERCRGSHD